MTVISDVYFDVGRILSKWRRHPIIISIQIDKYKSYFDYLIVLAGGLG